MSSSNCFGLILLEINEVFSRFSRLEAEVLSSLMNLPISFDSDGVTVRTDRAAIRTGLDNSK